MNENAEMGYVLTGAIEGTAMLVKGSAYAVQEILRLLQWAMKKSKIWSCRLGNMKIWQSLSKNRRKLGLSEYTGRR